MSRPSPLSLKCTRPDGVGEPWDLTPGRLGPGRNGECPLERVEGMPWKIAGVARGKDQPELETCFKSARLPS